MVNLSAGDYAQVIQETNPDSDRYVGKVGQISRVIYEVQFEGPDTEGTCLAISVIPAEAPKEPVEQETPTE